MPPSPSRNPSSPSILPHALQEVLALLPESDGHKSLQATLEAAAEAIATLGDLDLSLYEGDDEREESSAIWEILAPVLDDTQQAVHAFLRAVRSTASLTPPSSDSPLARMLPILNRVAAGLESSVGAFGVWRRAQEEKGGRWDILEHVGAYRGRLQADIGEVVFTVVSVLGRVEKSEVVPGYSEAIEMAVTLRRALAELTHDVQELNEHIRRAINVDPEADISGEAAALEAALEDFAEREAYDQLRIMDRRFLMSTRALLRREPLPPNSDMQAMAVELSDFLRSKSINSRETLVLNDGKAKTAATTALRDARTALGFDSEAAAAAAAAALQQIRRLEGRNPAADALIWSFRGVELDRANPDRLSDDVDTLTKALRAAFVSETSGDAT